MQAVNIESDYSLNLFQCSNSIGSNPNLDKKLQYLNNMIELDYIEFGINGLQFTNSGINYMEKKCKEFINNCKGKDIDFGPFTNKIKAILNSSNHSNMSIKFSKNNNEFKSNTDDIDYNNIQFEKTDKQMELEG